MSVSNPSRGTLSARDRSLLAAVTTGRVEITGGPEPDLFVDGLFFCDQEAAHRLANDGLIERVTNAFVGDRSAAVLAAAGVKVLAEAQRSTEPYAPLRFPSPTDTAA